MKGEVVKETIVKVIAAPVNILFGVIKAAGSAVVKVGKTR